MTKFIFNQLKYSQLRYNHPLQIKIMNGKNHNFKKRKSLGTKFQLKINLSQK